MSPSNNLYGIISDVHGNLEALTTALKFLTDLNVTQIYCLGDLVGYGASARECVDLARDNNIICVQGNHDAQVRPPRDPQMRAEAQTALDWAASQLDDEDMDWLAGLSTTIPVEDDMVLVHGSLTGRDDYILRMEDADRNFDLMEKHFNSIPVCFFGHTHLGMLIGSNGKVRTPLTETTTLQMLPDTLYLMNPGSVGQPRDRVPMTSFCVYDPQIAQITLVRLEYDIAREQERIRAANLPEKLWQRLALGR